MADISKINKYSVKDETARSNHDTLVQEVNETIEAINKALAELEYTLPVATSSALGGIKIGYTASGANLPLKLSSEKAYVALTSSAVTSALGYTPLSLDGGTLNQNATLKFNTYGTRFLTISGNSISADMSNETGGWAGSFASVKAPGGTTTTMLGWYGGASGLTHIFMGGTYSDPAMKMTPDGYFTFKNIPKVGTLSLALMSDIPSVSVTQALTSGIEIGSVKVGNTTTKLYAPTATEIDLSGYVPTSSNEATRIYSSNSIALETKGNFATRVYNSDNQLAGSISISTNGESVNIKGMSVGITADFGLVSLTSGDNASLTLSDVAEFSSAVHAPSFFEGNVSLSAKYGSKTDVQHHIDFFEALSGGVYDLSAYKFATKSELSNYVDGQALTEARVDLSNYFKELDTFYGDNYNVSAGTDGINWNNNVAFIGDHGEYQGKYWGNVPIVAGDNVTFTVDSTNQVVKINANLSNYATTTYVDNSVASLVGGAPETLNALNELAAALGNDPNFATTMATELGKKQPTITGAATTITSSNLTASRALVSDANGKVAVSAVTSTELGYLDGVTSAIQTQLNGTVKLAGAQTITGDKTTTGLFKIQNGAASGAFVLGGDVNSKTLTANVRKLGRMGVPSYDSTSKTVAGISFDSQQYANYADFGGHPNNTSSIAPDVIRFTVANSHTNAINGARTLALQISKQAGLSDTSGGGTSVAGAKFFVPVIVDGNLSATSLTENGTALSDKYLGKTAKASSATVADSANAVAWSKVTGKPTLATVATSGSYNDLSNKPTIPAAVSVTQKLTSGTEIGSVTIGSTTTKLYAPTATSVDLSGYLPLSGGTIKGNILFSNSNAQGSQPNLKWKTINSKTPYVGYCTASTDGTFLVASLGGTSYTTGLSIGGSSGNLLWKGTRVATTADIPSLSNYSTLANTIKALSISGKTITYTKGDGTTGTLTTQDTVYSLPTASSSTLGGVKTTSTVTSASGYTACPIIGGVPYYKDTGSTSGTLYRHNIEITATINGKSHIGGIFVYDTRSTKHTTSTLYAMYNAQMFNFSGFYGDQGGAYAFVGVVSITGNGSGVAHGLWSQGKNTSVLQFSSMTFTINDANYILTPV